MKVALNPAELRLIVDALDDKHQFQLPASDRQGREPVSLSDFRRQFHLTRLRDVAQTLWDIFSEEPG